jgi:hypothetical protein
MADVQGFIQQYGPVAAAVSQRLGVAPDVLLGQWGLETGWGKSVIPGTNNLGNIKGPGVAAKDNQTGSIDQYRAYPSPAEFGSDFANLIANNYRNAVGKGADATAYAGALKAGGYAEDPKYVSKLAGAVDMVRKFGDTIASALSGSANAAELSPAQMGGVPVISATGQRLNGPQATSQPMAASPTPQSSTGDGLLDMAHGVLGGISTSAGATPNVTAASTSATSASASDPLMAMADSIMNGKGDASGTASSTNGAAQPNLQPTITGQSWQTPGSVMMGMGDAIKGGVQSLVHGGAWLANKVAPDSQFTNDINAAVPQIDQTIQAQNAQYTADRAAQQPQTLAGIVTGQRQAPGTDWGRMAGNVIGAAPLAAALPTGSGVLGTIGAGMLSGAASGMLEPVTTPGNFLQQKLGQAATGAAVGAVANPLVKAVGSAVSPAVGAAQQKLLDAGVPLTPGQILGGSAARTEAKLTSVPVLGDMIKGAQQRALAGFNKATYDQVLKPLGQKYSGPVGSEGVANVQSTISQAYDNALSKLTFKADPQFQTDLGALSSMAQSLPQAQQQQFMSVIKNQIVGKLSPQGTMDGPTLKGVQSELGRISRGLGGDPSFDNQQLGQAISEVRNLVESSLTRNNAPGAVQDLANANAAYANFVRLRAAAASQGAMNNEGIFTAGQLNNAVRSADKSAGKNATATGNALMQDFSTAGQSVLGSKYPDSGTVGRGLMALLAPGSIGAGLATAPVSTLTTLGGIGVGALPYTATGQRLAQALLTARPGFAVPVRNGLSQFVVPLAAPTGNALVNAITQGK